MGAMGLIFTASVAFLAAKVAPSDRQDDSIRPVPLQRSEALDPDYEASWFLKRIGAEEAWKVSRGDASVVVAVVDSGVDYNSPELAANIHRNFREWPLDGKDSDQNGFIDDVIGWDFLRNKNLPHDPNGHGTFIAGMIAAVARNGIGSVGVCPECSIMPVRFSNRDGFGDTEDMAKAIEYAARNGASVINVSFAGEGADRDLKKSLEFAGEKDVLVIVAAGNDSENIDRSNTYPARYEMDHLITVTAVDEQDQLLDSASWGKKHVHVAAPGIRLIAPWSDGTIWKKGRGTSFAAPIVAGVAGLVRAAAPHLKAPQVREILLATARPVRGLQRKLVTGGVVDAAAALACARRSSLPCLRASRP
ncbi:MAG: hypothetical protein RJB38_2211 [Pseudomonadota bacterium]